MSHPGNWIIAALEGAQASSGTGRQDPGYFHPSGLGNECDAALAFAYLGAPAVESIAARTQRIYDYGNDRDGYLKIYMKIAGLSLITNEEERKINIPHLHIRGELDDWVKNPITGEKFVIDYKTMRSGLWKDLGGVTRGHLLQLHPYMYDKETYKGFVMYENKDTQELKAMPANFASRIWQNDISDRLLRILDGLEHNLVYRTPTHCTSCPFFANGVCTSNEIARLKEVSGLWQ